MDRGNVETMPLPQAEELGEPRVTHALGRDRGNELRELAEIDAPFARFGRQLIEDTLERTITPLDRNTVKASGGFGGAVKVEGICRRRGYP